MSEFSQRAEELISTGRLLYQRGMVPATSGNFSAKLSDGSIAITVSGRHKGELRSEDIMRVDMQGESLDGQKPSAETLLHTQIYRLYPEAQVILHPHSINATLLSKLCDEPLQLQDYELLKALSGIDSHESRIEVPIFDNDQNIPRLAEAIEAWRQHRPISHGYLIRGHGFYTWGASLNECLRHVEAFEFLFTCEMRLRGR